MLSKFGIKCQTIFGLIEKASLEEQHLAPLICLLETLEKLTWYTYFSLNLVRKKGNFSEKTTLVRNLVDFEKISLLFDFWQLASLFRSKNTVKNTEVFARARARIRGEPWNMIKNLFRSKIEIIELWKKFL